MGGYLLRRLALILPTLLGIPRWGVAGRAGMARWNRSATARPASTRSWWPPWSASTASTSRRCNGSG